MDADVQNMFDKHEERLNLMEKCQNDISISVGQLMGKADSTLNLIKYVVFPLLIIVGVLAGVNLVWPGP